MTDKEKLREIKVLADAMYNAAQYLTTDASRLHDAMEKYHQFVINEYYKEEPVGEDLPHIRHRDTLDEFAYQCAYDMSNDWAIENPTWHDVEDACKLGAKWQKEQDQSTIELAEDHAMLAGMEKMKEQMMAKSVEAVVSQVPCSNEIILYNPSSVDKYYLPQEMNKLGLNKGDKVKLVIIKED